MINGMGDNKVKKNNPVQVIAGLILLLGASGLSLWILLKIWLIFWDFISRSKPEVGAAIIAASGTILISVFTLVWTRIWERRKELEQRKWELEQEIRKQKLPIYEELVGFLFDIVDNSRTGKSMTPDEMNKRLIYFTQKTVVWGSDQFLKDFGKFRGVPTNQAQPGSTSLPDPKTIMLNFEKLLYSIRTDFGHENKGLGETDLLILFINDIRDYVKK
jgi:hypothetical protein